MAHRTAVRVLLAFAGLCAALAADAATVAKTETVTTAAASSTVVAKADTTLDTRTVITKALPAPDGTIPPTIPPVRPPTRH